MNAGGRRRDAAKLRRRARGWLRDLDMRPPLDIEELGRRFGEARDRPILFKPYDLPVPGPFAVTWVDARADVVLYPEAAGQLRQNHCKAHELGHLFAGHPPQLIAGMHTHRRTKYDSAEEWEAEVIASIILGWAMAPRAMDQPDTRHTPGVERAQRAFILHRRDWL